MKGRARALVGVTFCHGSVRGVKQLRTEDKYCGFIGQALRREPFSVGADKVTCPLARYQLSIGETDLAELARILVGWGDAADEQIGLSLLRSAPRLRKPFHRIIFSSPPREDLNPDVLVGVSSAAQAFRAVKHHAVESGTRVVCPTAGAGAACGECTAHAIMQGEPVVSVGCGGSRPAIGLAEGELLVAAPAGSLMAGILRGDL